MITIFYVFMWLLSSLQKPNIALEEIKIVQDNSVNFSYWKGQTENIINEELQIKIIHK